jgi:hypothetical protein
MVIHPLLPERFGDENMDLAIGVLEECVYPAREREYFLSWAVLYAIREAFLSRAVLRLIGHNTFLRCFPILQLLTLRSSRLIEVDPVFPVPCEYQRWKHQHAERYVSFESSSIRFNLLIQYRTTFNFRTPPIHPRSPRTSSPQRLLLISGLEKERSILPRLLICPLRRTRLC